MATKSIKRARRKSASRNKYSNSVRQFISLYWDLYAPFLREMVLISSSEMNMSDNLLFYGRLLVPLTHPKLPNQDMWV